MVRGTVQDTDGPPRIMLMNFQNQSIPYFCSTHFSVQAEGGILLRECSTK